MRLSMAGFVAIAVAFGPARNGYGLFLPNFREEFGLSVELSGFIASGLQAGYLVALTAVGLLVAKVGPRPLVVLGGLAAAVGMTLVASASSILVFAIGIVLAGTSAGWSWAPYNDAADLMVPAGVRGRVLSIISTGTTFGIVVAGIVALGAGASWRVGWVAFAAAAILAVALNTIILPAGRHNPYAERFSEGPTRSSAFGWFLRPGAIPLFIVAFSFGVVSTFYWSFAVDHISRSDGFTNAAGPIFFVMMGVAGFIGLFTGDAISHFGLRRVLMAILISQGASAILLGMAPTSWPAVGVSAVFFGADVMLMSALLAVWSSWIFAEQPSTGFSATLFLLGTGCIVGPAALGIFAGSFGLGAAFLLAGTLSLLTTLVRIAGKASVPSKPQMDEARNSDAEN